MAITHLHIANEVGIAGENAAVHLLEQKGYRILERNWKLQNLEIDIIASNKEDIVFTEVKSRTSTIILLPEEAVNKEKERNIAAAAGAYIKLHHVDKYPRFDIIGVLCQYKNNDTGDKVLEVTEIHHLEDAFHPPMRTTYSSNWNGQSKWRKKTHRRSGF